MKIAGQWQLQARKLPRGVEKIPQVNISARECDHKHRGGRKKVEIGHAQVGIEHVPSITEAVKTQKGHFLLQIGARIWSTKCQGTISIRPGLSLSELFQFRNIFLNFFASPPTFEKSLRILQDFDRARKFLTKAYNLAPTNKSIQEEIEKLNE